MKPDTTISQLVFRPNAYKGIFIKWVSALWLFIVSVVTPPQPYVYDALGYWRGALALIENSLPYEAGALDVRGVFTPIVYFPAAVIETFGISDWGSYAVIITNSIILVCLGVLIIPKILKGVINIDSPVTDWIPMISAPFCYLFFKGFLPYPLMDLIAATIFFLAIALIKFPPLAPRRLVLVGFLIAISINLRPAYLFPAVVAFMLYLIFIKLSGLWVTVGISIGLIPQLMLNLLKDGKFLFWPVKTEVITATQIEFAGYVTRYDTVLVDPTRGPPQFYCDPQMAHFFASAIPKGIFDVLVGYAATLPHSLIFSLSKISGLLFWDAETPYGPSLEGQISYLTVWTVAIASLGITQLGFLSFGASKSKEAFVLIAATFGIFGSVLVTTPESRFGLPLLIIGIIGFISILINLLSNLSNFKSLVWVIPVSLLLFVSIMIFGNKALSYPAQPGFIDVSSCF